MRILVTGGAGFIGSAVVRYLLDCTPHHVVNFDKLTYAADPASASISHPRYRFEHGDVCNRTCLDTLFADIRPNAVMHLAAESHVDRSIDAPGEFLRTNVLGTYELIDAALAYWRGLDSQSRAAFRFHHVSTDEVFGDLAPSDPPFSESTRYDPSSPYSASKAASDHIVRAWGRTYGLPIVVSNCSNNYGPGQIPEKLIPLMILNAVDGVPLPIYGDGRQIRDWLYVADHAAALYAVMTRGRVGQTYNIGGSSERTNLEVVTAICDTLDRLRPDRPGDIGRYADLIVSVADRPGHDRRYAINSDKMRDELGWVPEESFESGLEKTVAWYLANHRGDRARSDEHLRARRGMAVSGEAR